MAASEGKVSNYINLRLSSDYMYVSSYNNRTADRGLKLKEALELQQFLRVVEDTEEWIAEMEAQLATEDLGKDLISVNNLIKRHQVIMDSVHTLVYLKCFNFSAIN